MPRLVIAALLVTASCGDDSAPPPAKKSAAEPAPEPEDDKGLRIRKVTASELKKDGFAVIDLPTLGERTKVAGKLRPLHEIGGRAMALEAVYAWSTATEQEVPSEVITAFVQRSSLQRYLNPTEKEVLAQSRGAAKVGQASEAPWCLEDMWALAWVLGFPERPRLTGGVITDDERTKLREFLPGYDADLKTFITAADVRGISQVLAAEDLFYCAHAASRRAQSGKSTVPSGFGVETDGLAIHERRHALTWSISPGTNWDETDLSGD